jgi:hypothetical protein
MTLLGSTRELKQRPRQAARFDVLSLDPANPSKLPSMLGSGLDTAVLVAGVSAPSFELVDDELAPFRQMLMHRDHERETRAGKATGMEKEKCRHTSVGTTTSKPADSVTTQLKKPRPPVRQLTRAEIRKQRILKSILPRAKFVPCQSERLTSLLEAIGANKNLEEQAMLVAEEARKLRRLNQPINFPAPEILSPDLLFMKRMEAHAKDQWRRERARRKVREASEALDAQADELKRIAEAERKLHERKKLAVRLVFAGRALLAWRTFYVEAHERERTRKHIDQVLTKLNLQTLRALHSLQLRWRRRQALRKVRKLRVWVQSVLTFRTAARHSSAKLLQRFLRDTRYGTMLAAIYRFRVKVIRCQQYIHSYLLVTKHRLQILGLLWDKAEHSIKRRMVIALRQECRRQIADIKEDESATTPAPIQMSRIEGGPRVRKGIVSDKPSSAVEALLELRLKRQIQELWEKTCNPQIRHDILASLLREIRMRFRASMAKRAPASLSSWLEGGAANINKAREFITTSIQEQAQERINESRPADRAAPLLLLLSQVDVPEMEVLVKRAWEETAITAEEIEH